MLGTSTPNGFGHIYFDEWKIGESYCRKLADGSIIELGTVQSKQLIGRSYDPDIEITFQLPDGTTYKHVVEFDSSYKSIIPQMY